MKLPPFVIGTDIVQLSRLDPLVHPKRFLYLARRTMHPTELSRLIRHFPAISPLFNDDDTTSRSIFANDSTPAAQPLSPEAHELSASNSHSSNDHTSAKTLNVDELRNFFRSLDPTSVKGLHQSLASRWASKEAARKAWGATLVSWRDVTVHHVPGGREPGSAGGGREIVLSPFDGTRPNGVFEDMRAVYAHDEQERTTRAVEVKEMGDMMLQRGRLSISHDGGYCVATVLAEPIRSEIRAVLEERWHGGEEETSER